MKKQSRTTQVKRSILLVFLSAFAMALHLNAQSPADYSLILRQCVDMPELQQHYPNDSKGNYEQVFIMQYPLLTCPILTNFKTCKL